MIKNTNDNLVKGSTNNMDINEKYDSHFQKTVAETLKLSGLCFFEHFKPSVNHKSCKSFSKSMCINKLSKKGYKCS